MNFPIQMILILLSSAAAATPTQPDGWRAEPDARLSFFESGSPVYTLDCAGPELVVTQFGVTELLDLQTDSHVSDSEGSSLPAGAAVMALATDKTEEPNMVAATAVRNARKGWDMTIRLAKKDPALLSLPRATFISLFTTGFTRAVQLGREDRELVSAFVRQCRGR
jgi:hypothetical protein